MVIIINQFLDNEDYMMTMTSYVRVGSGNVHLMQPSICLYGQISA
jgi:hypothetical protein